MVYFAFRKRTIYDVNITKHYMILWYATIRFYIYQYRLLLFSVHECNAVWLREKHIVYGMIIKMELTIHTHTRSARAFLSNVDGAAQCVSISHNYHTYAGWWNNVALNIKRIITSLFWSDQSLLFLSIPRSLLIDSFLKSFLHFHFTSLTNCNFYIEHTSIQAIIGRIVCTHTLCYFMCCD